MTTSLCCRRFYICFSPEELWENYRHFHLEPSLGEKDANGHWQMNDIHLVADMVRYVGFRMASYSEVGPQPNPEPGHVYTCRHIQADGHCSIHAERPQVCRLYTDCKYGPNCDSTWCSCRPGAEQPKEEKEHGKEDCEEAEQETDG